MLERNIKHFIFFYLSTSNLRCSMFCLNVHFNRHFHTVVDKNTRFGIMSRFYSKTHFLDQTKYMFLVSTSVSLSFRMISQKFQNIVEFQDFICFSKLYNECTAFLGAVPSHISFNQANSGYFDNYFTISEIVWWHRMNHCP